MAKHMRPPRRRTGRILRGIVPHAGGRVGPRRRSNPPGGRIISTRELTYVRRRLTVLIAMFSVVTMVVLLSVRGCSNDGDGSCVLSSCYRPVWREFSFRKSGRF